MGNDDRQKQGAERKIGATVGIAGVALLAALAIGLFAYVMIVVMF